MAKAVGLMNPDNAAKSSGGAFKEGVVRIDSNCYKVHKAGEGTETLPATKWSWSVTRLAEGGQEPLLDEHDEPITEELLFSFGGKCLPFVHPGKADSPEDEEPEDVGISVDAEGNTIFLVAADWKPHEKSGIMTLTRSMTAAGIKSDFLNRCWAPDWNGCVFDMKSVAGDKGSDGKSYNMKVVSKVLVGPGSGKKAGAGKAGAKAASADAETTLAPILHKLSESLDGQQLTYKAFLNRVRTEMETAKVDSKLLVPVLSLCKDENWLKAHGETFDFTVYPDDRTIIFGTPAGVPAGI